MTDNKKRLHLIKDIEAKRIKKGISKYKIAQDTGYSQQSVGQILSGEANPTFDKMNKIVEAIGGEITITWKKPKL